MSTLILTALVAALTVLIQGTPCDFNKPRLGQAEQMEHEQTVRSEEKNAALINSSAVLERSL